MPGSSSVPRFGWLLRPISRGLHRHYRALACFSGPFSHFYRVLALRSSSQCVADSGAGDRL
eukprot:15456995-Alexandrium_andersonii.AAC.1